MIRDLVLAYGRDLLAHVVVSSAILAAALAAAAWIRPLTARTRHAILIAGLAALVVPAGVVSALVERAGMQQVVIRGAFPLLLRVPAAPVTPKATPFPWIEIVAVLWLAIALVLLVRWWLVTRRLVATALRAATPPPARAVAALNAARQRLGMRHPIDLIASPLCEAPAVVRVLRPIIVLPADGCDGLESEELESLLCHECAHVARRDNLLGVLEAVACSLFWFNPLVWLVHHRIAAAREEACDERVADAALPAETYVGALAKICRSLLAPRVPAVSCMASLHLKERIEHLMRYETLRTSALPHRLISAAASAAIALFIVTAGVLTAGPIRGEAKSGDRYLLNYSVIKQQNDAIAVRGEIVDTETKEVIAQPTVITRGSEAASTEIGSAGRKWRVDVTPDGTGGGTIILTVWNSGSIAQRSSFQFGKQEIVSRPPQFKGEPISLDLENADIRDVINTFAQLTGLKITAEPDVRATVTVHFRDTPWDQAFDQLIRENGFDYTIASDGSLSVFVRK